MKNSFDDWGILNRHGVHVEDFEEGKCETCHEKVLVTSIILTFHVWLRFEELTKSDQKSLIEESRKKQETVPTGYTLR